MGREKAERVSIEGVEDWSKMKESRGKNKKGKLETHFSSAAHASALQDYLHFDRDDNHVDRLLTKKYVKKCSSLKTRLLKIEKWLRF